MKRIFVRFTENRYCLDSKFLCSSDYTAGNLPSVPSYTKKVTLIIERLTDLQLESCRNEDSTGAAMFLEKYAVLVVR